eukprot:s573_g7.t1
MEKQDAYTSLEDHILPVSCWQDEIIHFSWAKGQMLGEKKEYARYQVQKLLGDGTFGRVLLCRDSKENQEVAVKVIRDVRRLAKAAGAEPSGQMREQKVHAVAARSTFGSQNVQNTTFGALLEVEMWKKYTASWREAHFEVKVCNAPQVRSAFGS